MTDARRIVITGVGRGLGLAMTAGYIERGHAVIGCSQSADNVKKLIRRFGKPHRFDAVNVADEGQVRRWAESVVADGEPPDLLINNAAIVNKNAPLWKVPADEFSRIIDVNIKGVFYVC